MSSRSAAVGLCERLSRPQRVGIVGHRGVGKTTLLTMLYREAVGGRLPGLRLAAADAGTATYLADKIGQLEAGEALPATLAETELRFHLYHEETRHELVCLDYQGEHVALGRKESIHDFLRECDVVLLCLDAPVAGDAQARWRAEQEIEAVVEDYLALERAGEPHRPMALLVTKSDLFGDPGDAQALGAVFEDKLGMTRHTLGTHCRWHDCFAVSSLGPAGSGELRPAGLDAVLTWLAGALRGQDEARLRHLWEVAPNNLRVLDRATRAWTRRYPSDRAWRAKWQQRRWSLRLRRAAVAAVAVVALWLGAYIYDAVGAARVIAYQDRHSGDPAAVRETWLAYQRWHPTRRLTRPFFAEYERKQIVELETVLRQRDRDERMSRLRRLADDPDADAEAVWDGFLQFRRDYPEFDPDAEARALRERIKRASDARRDERQRQERARREQAAQVALRELDRAEQSAALPALAEMADRLLREHAGTRVEAELLRRRTAYRARQDERTHDAARDYSTRNPHNYYTRKQKYQEYLDRHPRGAFASQARVALARIADEWDRHDFRIVADHYREKPGDVKGLRTRCRTYLEAHPSGRWRDKATELLRWCDQVSEPGEYKVVLRSGSFSKKAAHLVSRGTSLSVEIEVAGVRYGPSSIVYRDYEPEWDYEFPRRVRWKLGDPVRIIVTDNYFWRRQVADETFDDELLAMRRLSGEVEVSYGSLTFSSDFRMPTVPKVE